MTQATAGNTVRFTFRTLADDGAVVGGSDDKGLEISLGAGQIFPKIEETLEGMAVGETRNVTLQPVEAFGPHQQALVHVVERGAIPPNIDVQVGVALTAQGDDGKEVQLMVVEMNDDTVTLDANHPLAGQTLTFELTLVDIAA